MFRYGEIATPAMALLAENGDTKKLEIDMKSSSHNIRSVIKARFSNIWVFNKKTAILYCEFGLLLVLVHFSTKLKISGPSSQFCLPYEENNPKSLLMVMCGQGTSAEVKRCWSNLCCLSDGRHQASFVPNLQNYPKVTLTHNFQPILSPCKF